MVQENINNTLIPDTLCKYIPSLIEYIGEDKHNHTNDIFSTFGTKFSPFGQGKLQILSVINLALSIQENPKLAAILSEENLPEIIMVRNI